MPSQQKPQLTESELTLIAKALADPRRYEILKRISVRSTPTPCSELLQSTDVVPATLSHHMKELEGAGLIRSERSGKFVHYFPRTEILKAYLGRVKTDLL
jgi:ArsR family transcriptional regulator